MVQFSSVLLPALHNPKVFVNRETACNQQRGEASPPHGTSSFSPEADDRRPAEVAWAERPLDELMDHIVEHYHASIRLELPRLVGLAYKVEKVYAGDPQCPRGIGGHLTELLAVVEDHLVKEQRILFPMIEGGRGASALLPVKVMMQEHDDLFAILQRNRALTNDFSLPPDSCSTWQALYEGLARLELELAEHILLENQVLFPRAVRETRSEP